jgi:hypothetical protein
MYENYLDTIKDFSKKNNNTEILKILKIFTETNREGTECPNDSLAPNGAFNNNSIIKTKYIDVFMGTLLGHPGTKFKDKEQVKFFKTLRLFNNNCVGFCGNFSNNWFTNQFINWDNNLWNNQDAHNFINQANHFRDIIVIENAEGYDLTTLMLKYLKDEYDLFPPEEGPGGYIIKLIRFKNPTTLIDSESTKNIQTDEIVIGLPPPPVAEETDIISIRRDIGFYNIDDLNLQNINSNNNNVGDNLNQRLNNFWGAPNRILGLFQVTGGNSPLYLRNVFDYNINVGNNQCNLSDIYSSYFDFIKTYYNSIQTWMNYTPKFYFRLAKLTDNTGNNNTKYRILLTTEVVHNNNHRRVSFVLNDFGNKSSIETYMTDLDGMMEDNPNFSNLLPNIYNDETDIPATNYQVDPPQHNNLVTFETFLSDINFNQNLFIPWFGPNQNQVYEDDTLLKINYGIILIQMFNSINATINNEKYMKRLLYTFKLIGDQGQVRFAKLLKEHIQNNPGLRTQYSVLYTSKDYPSHVYAGLLGQESFHVNGYYFGNEIGSNFKFQDKLDYYKTKLGESALPQFYVDIGPPAPPPPPGQGGPPPPAAQHQNKKQKTGQPSSSLAPPPAQQQQPMSNNNA